MNNKYIATVLVIALALLIGCSTQSISEVKSEDNVGKKVMVSGTVKESIKLGELSGYVLEDDSGDKIKVSSDSLPAEGEDITVSGTLIRDTIFGYYIQKG